MNTTTRLYDAIEGFPDPVLAEIVDFAEFLRSKRLDLQSIASDEPLLTLSGGLEASKTFAVDPLETDNPRAPIFEIAKRTVVPL